jgi:hypothetical protein
MNMQQQQVRCVRPGQSDRADEIAGERIDLVGDRARLLGHGRREHRPGGHGGEDVGRADDTWFAGKDVVAVPGLQEAGAQHIVAVEQGL